MRELDEVDRAILTILQTEGRVSFRELARRVHLSPAAATARVHALEEAGVIRGYRAELDPARLGRTVRAFVRLTASAATTRSISLAEEIARHHPAVREMHQVLGDCDVILYVEARDLRELDALVTDLGRYGSTSTTVVVDTIIDGEPLVP
ncbi:MAG: Lrp/AsnC family transcriptional regulator [Actinomyces sp.]|nr:MAG: Lrp/AsnC family transcriptional regulator [Actinomyces sp.]